MFSALHSNKSLQLVIGLGIGFLFGFLLQKGNVTEYDVIVGQLLFRDFTVVKIMVTAMVTGMIGVHALRSLGLVQLHPKPGSLGMTLVGGLIFGVGFAVLGYCPGTIAAAVGQGKMDACRRGADGDHLRRRSLRPRLPLSFPDYSSKGGLRRSDLPRTVPGQSLDGNRSSLSGPDRLAVLAGTGRTVSGLTCP